MADVSLTHEPFPTNLCLGVTMQGEEVRLSDDDSLKHLVVLGRSGCGKTSFLLGLLYQQIQRGGGYIFIDGKVSRTTIDQVYYLSKLAMRESLFRIFNPSDPLITHTYNPLIKAVQNIDKSNVAETLIKLLDPIPEGSLAQHYQTLTLNLLHRVVKVFHTIGKAATIRDLLEVLSHMDVVYPILAEEIKDAHMMRDLVEYYKYFQKEVLKAREEKFEGLDAKINSLLASKATKALCSPGSDIDFYNVIHKSQNVYVGLPMDRDPSIAAGLGRVILTDIRVAISEILGHTKWKPNPPFLIILDEFGSYATPDFSVVFEKSREANVIVVGAIQSLSNLTDGHKMLSRDFAERILGNANKIFMALESTHTAMEAERYWGEEIARKQSYNTSEGYTDSGRYLSPMRYLNPQRSKSLQDRKGWIEGWEPRIKGDEFIHGLGIGEAYLRHNGRPAKVKLIRADINPPEDFDLSQDLPRFSQGNEPPLNLTEKVNRVVMERMRDAKNNPKEERHDIHKTNELKRQKHIRKSKDSEKPPKTILEITAKDSPAEINNQPPGSDGLRGNASKQSATQLDSLKAQRSPELVDTSEESDPGATDQKQRETLDWFSTWDED
jgi:intracellular multiplication protein IcmO